jgi:flagellar biogenesis protein FliO
MDLIQSFAGVVLVMSLLGGALLVLKRRGLVVPRLQSGGVRKLEIIERVSLGPHHALHLVRTGDRCVLIATSPSSCQLLDAGERN